MRLLLAHHEHAVSGWGWWVGGLASSVGRRNRPCAHALPSCLLTCLICVSPLLPCPQPPRVRAGAQLPPVRAGPLRRDRRLAVARARRLRQGVAHPAAAAVRYVRRRRQQLGMAIGPAVGDEAEGMDHHRRDHVQIPRGAQPSQPDRRSGQGEATKDMHVCRRCWAIARSPVSICSRCSVPAPIRVKMLCGADLLESTLVPNLWSKEDVSRPCERQRSNEPRAVNAAGMN